MKTSFLIGAAIAILGVAAVPIIAQAQTNYIQTTKIVGTKVKTAQGQEVGVVKDVVLDRSSGCMAYTVLSTGGTGTRITGGGKLVAVPWNVYTTSSDPSVLTVSVERDKIYNAPVFEYSHINEYASTGYINNVYAHFGVSAGVSGQTSTTTTGAATTTTGATQTNVAPTGSMTPGASVSPAATSSPIATGSPMATASPSASPSESASASPSASPKEKRGAKPKSSVSPASPRHRGDQTMRGGNEESSENAETGSSTGSKKTKSSHKRSTEENAEPSGSPKTSGEQE
jgi:sporulation protein YlmC with PRC-barrel domain